MATATKRKPKPTATEEDSELIELVVDGIECRIDIDALDYGEYAEVEEFMGVTFGVDPVSFAGAKGQIMLGYLARKRVDPGWTLEKTLRLKPGQIEVKDARPTETGDDSGAPS